MADFSCIAKAVSDQKRESCPSGDSWPEEWHLLFHRAGKNHGL